VTTALLVHSPLVGPATTRPLADALAAHRWTCTVPDLRASTVDPVTFLTAAVAAVPAPDVVIGHSGAGAMLPAITSQLAATAIYLDAVVPGAGEWYRPPTVFLDALAALERADGRLAPWHEWWSGDLLAELLPDDDVRSAAASEIPSLPRRFYDVPIPLPAAWSQRPAGYVQLSPAYDDDARRAERHGWPVVRRASHHLDLVGEADSVAADVVALTDRIGRPRVNRRPAR
jgi:hypothetical protein